MGVSACVDNTLSRRSFVKGAAAAGALALASAGAARADVAVTVLPETWDYAADVVIVGYGAAGAMAAREAVAEGASAIVLEKCDEAMCGGSTCASAGAVFPNDPTAMYGWSRGYISQETIQAVVGEGMADAAWLDAHGLDRATGGKGVYATTKQAVDALGVNVLYETPARHLVLDPVTREVLGVQAEGPDGSIINVKANKGVLLASGGFLGNSELVARFVVPKEVGMANQGAPTCTGDGLLMAQSAGAALKNLTWMCLELNGQASVAFRKASEELGCGMAHTPTGEFCGARIIVNQQAKRFMDEDKEYIHTKSLYPPFDYGGGWMAYTGFKNLPMYLIFDSQLMGSGKLSGADTLSMIGWSYAKDIYTWSDDNQAELDRGWLVKADTIEELVEKLAENSGHEALDAAVLQETIDTYNSYCEQGADPEFHRAEQPNAFYGTPCLQQLGKPPYYAAELVPNAIYTIGGLHWGEDGSTLDWDGNPIPGLYHAGDVGQYSEVSVVGIEDCMGMGSYTCRTIISKPVRDISGTVLVEVEVPAADASAEADISAYYATASE